MSDSPLTPPHESEEEERVGQALKSPSIEAHDDADASKFPHAPDDTPNAPHASVEPCRGSQPEEVDWRVDHSEKRTSIQPQKRGFKYPLDHPPKKGERLILRPSPL